MHLTCCGITHRTGNLADREPFQIRREEIGSAVALYKRLTAAAEAVMVVTCNRVEFYRVDAEKTDARESLVLFYRNRGLATADSLRDMLFLRQGSSVARHLFKVASGLDSVLLGEYQVLGQVKTAYSSACAVGGPGKYLHKLFHHAFQVAKRIHYETDIGAGVQGLAGAAVDLLQERFGVDFTSRDVVVIGVNRSVEILLARLMKAKARVTILNRTLYNAEKLAKVHHIRAASLNELPRFLSSADVLFSATSAPNYVLGTGDFERTPRKKPLIAVDLAVPRDIDPEVAGMGDVNLLDLDDLKRHLESVMRERAVETPYALELIEEQVTAFENWRRSLNGSGNAELRRLIEEDRRRIFDRFKDHFHRSDIKALDAFSHNLCRQFIRRINANRSVDAGSENNS